MKRLVLALALFAGAAQAGFRDGNKLLSDMKNENYYNKGVALGYIIGVADAGDGIYHCAPDNVTAGQIFDMVKNSLENVPAVRHMSADLIVNHVLKTTWPCEKKKGNAL